MSPHRRVDGRNLRPKLFINLNTRKQTNRYEQDSLQTATSIDGTAMITMREIKSVLNLCT